MDQCEDREEGVPPSKSTLCGEHESQTKAQSPVSVKKLQMMFEQKYAEQSKSVKRIQQQRPDSAELSSVPMESDESMYEPTYAGHHLNATATLGRTDRGEAAGHWRHRAL